MKVSAKTLIQKINDLPKGFGEMVHWGGQTVAEVESFSSSKMGPYTVSITVHKDDPGDRSLLNVVCNCTATKVCQHITAFYAVAKGLVPPEKQRGLHLISEGIEHIADGIALVVREELRKQG